MAANRDWRSKHGICWPDRLGIEPPAARFDDRFDGGPPARRRQAGLAERLRRRGSWAISGWPGPDETPSCECPPSATTPSTSTRRLADADSPDWVSSSGAIRSHRCHSQDRPSWAAGLVDGRTRHPPSFGDPPHRGSTTPLLTDERRLAESLTGCTGCGHPVRRTSSSSPRRQRPARQPEVEPIDPWKLGAGFTFLVERLHFLVWANTWDFRSGDGRSGGGRRRPNGLGRHRRTRRTSGSTDRISGSMPARADPSTSPRARRVGCSAGSVGALRRSSRRIRRSLSGSQLAAVDHGSGPARVIAPAGSGKTRTLTARLLELVDRRGYEPDLVTALAYNNRAAAEMRDRLERPELQIRTFHSLGWAILRKHVRESRSSTSRRSGRPRPTRERPAAGQHRHDRAVHRSAR
jgi:hypothetical protein